VRWQGSALHAVRRQRPNDPLPPTAPLRSAPLRSAPLPSARTHALCASRAGRRGRLLRRNVARARERVGHRRRYRRRLTRQHLGHPRGRGRAQANECDRRCGAAHHTGAVRCIGPSAMRRSRLARLVPARGCAGRRRAARAPAFGRGRD
jgi:hypothetical protein